MQKYQKFMVETLAMVGEMDRLADRSVEGKVVVNAKLFDAMVRGCKLARGTLTKHLDFARSQELMRLRTTFGTVDTEPVRPGQNKGLTKIVKEDDRGEIQQKRQGPVTETMVRPLSETEDDAGGEDRGAVQGGDQGGSADV